MNPAKEFNRIQVYIKTNNVRMYNSRSVTRSDLTKLPGSISIESPH